MKSSIRLANHVQQYFENIFLLLSKKILCLKYEMKLCLCEKINCNSAIFRSGISIKNNLI